jgi:glycosyltransferase involved in cell wall biosynthesis
MNVALLCDSPDEQWPSMDLVAQMHATELTRLGLPYQSFAPPIHRRTPSFALDRLLFRFGDYPRLARRLNFDVYHVIDHSYSQLLFNLPVGRAVVTCHDIDTFRSVLEPKRDPRGPAFRFMTRRILSGFVKAAHVACDSIATFNDIRKFDLLPAARMSVVPLGVHPSCSPHPNHAADAKAAALINHGEGPILLHVGSTLPRKRIDVLLRTFAAVHARCGDIRLVRVGGPFTPSQRELAAELGATSAIVELPFLDREVLAAVYRRATLVLQTSDAEGFGLPVAEAMACGTPVVASDLPVLREVGGDAAIYCPIGNWNRWSSQVLELLDSPLNPLQEKSLRQAAQFHWKHYTKQMAEVYNSLLNL